MKYRSKHDPFLLKRLKTVFILMKKCGFYDMNSETPAQTC